MTQVTLNDIHLQESRSLIYNENLTTQFYNAKSFEVPFIYSGGVDVGNYQSSVSVVQMGRILSGARFTSTVILTLHDIGLNHVTNYGSLFQNEEMKSIQENFTVFHVDFPCMAPSTVKNDQCIIGGFGGDNHVNEQENKWDSNLVYPSLDELANSVVPAVIDYFKLNSVIILSTGIGANVGIRFALRSPDKCSGLICINPIYYQMGWGEWANYRVNSLTGDKLAELILSYLFSSSELGDSGADIIEGTRQSIMNMDSNALLGLYTSFKTRTPINMERPTNTANDKFNTKILKVPICTIIGDYASDFMEDAMELNSLSNPKDSNFVKLADAGTMVFEEQPEKVIESIRLFLQGMGHMPQNYGTILSKSNVRSEEKKVVKVNYNSTFAF